MMTAGFRIVCRNWRAADGQNDRRATGRLRTRRAGRRGAQQRRPGAPRRAIDEAETGAHPRADRYDGSLEGVRNSMPPGPGAPSGAAASWPGDHPAMLSWTMSAADGVERLSFDAADPPRPEAGEAGPAGPLRRRA